MTTTIRARVRGGVLELLDKVELPEGKEVTLTISETYAPENTESFRGAAGSWKGTKPTAKTLIRRVYAARRAGTRRRPRL